MWKAIILGKKISVVAFIWKAMNLAGKAMAYGSLYRESYELGRKSYKTLKLLYGKL